MKPARPGRELVASVEDLAARLDAADYLADEGLATAMFLALNLPQPLLLEGEAGVGKTEAARALASATAASEISTPVRVSPTPRSASSVSTAPSPHPTSSTVAGRGIRSISRQT